MRQEVKLSLCLVSSVVACFALAALSSSFDSVIANMSPPEEFPEESEKENVPIFPQRIIMFFSVQKR